MSTPVVFFDGAGPDLEEQVAFYSNVFGWTVVLALFFTDPAGNRMGLVEMDGDKRKVP